MLLTKKKHMQVTAPMRPRAKQPKPVSPRSHSRKTLPPSVKVRAKFSNTSRKKSKNDYSNYSDT